MTKRSPRKTTNVDLSNPFEGTPNGCWGVMWQPGCFECNICADNATCAIVFDKKLEPEKTLDKVNFNLIDKGSFIKDIKNNPTYWTADKLINYVKEKSGCIDEAMVRMWLVTFIEDNNIEI